MDYSERWEIVEALGSGGQGKVYRVMKKLELLKAQKQIITSITQIPTISDAKAKNDRFNDFKSAILKIIEIDKPSNQGALKELHIPSEARDANLAEERIKREINGMSQNLHPNLLNIIEVDDDYKWYVSNLYPNGSLANNRDLFKGNLYASLKAIRPLVEGVSKLHKNNYVHRDIKPHNIFLSSENELVLGDFGLLYYQDLQKTRISETFENVGSRDWMPGWAMGIRVEDVTPSFDVFALGKVLWSMVSGFPILQLWYYYRDQYNVEELFPDSPHIKFANQLFSKCIVEEEEDCLKDASDLLEEIDRLIDTIQFKADQIDLEIPRRCKVCGIGSYVADAIDNLNHVREFGFNPTGSRTMRIFSCDHCGHVQLFSHSGELPPAWKS